MANPSRARGGKHRNAETPGYSRHPTHMIRVLVRNDDGVDVTRVHAAGGEAPLELARAEAAIEHQAGIGAAHEQRVARAAASEGTEIHAGIRRGDP